MKKMIILATLMMLTLTGCGTENKEIVEVKSEVNTITENTIEESDEIYETDPVIVSKEYLEELEYNSMKNVY